jgi:SAM-dependent methyltransferase
MEWEPPRNLMEMLRLGADRPLIPPWQLDLDGLTLNLGAGNKLIRGSVALDLPKWDADLERIPYDDETVANIYALHFLEHVADPIVLLRECQRVLIVGGHLNIVVPYWNTELAHSDLDHKHFFSEETWDRIFSNPYYDKDHDGWQFHVGTNVIAGIAERNKLLITQLIKYNLLAGEDEQDTHEASGALPR